MYRTSISIRVGDARLRRCLAPINQPARRRLAAARRRPPPLAAACRRRRQLVMVGSSVNSRRSDAPLRSCPYFLPSVLPLARQTLVSTTTASVAGLLFFTAKQQHPLQAGCDLLCPAQADSASYPSGTGVSE